MTNTTPSRESATAERSTQWYVPLAVGSVFVFAFMLRWLVLGSLGGDDHWALWTAATFLGGDRPFQQFVDPGDPLYWGMSALGQVLTGYRAIGEVLVGLTLIGWALAASFRMSWQASRSLWIAIGLTIVATFLMAPTKLYSYPKIFLYPFGIFLAWRYIDRPTWGRALALAAGVAVAFGYRHDHGAYLAVGASAAVVAAHAHNGLREVSLSLVRVGALTVAILSPYFALIQMNEGLVPYFQERINFASKIDEAGRRLEPFTVDASAPKWFTVAPQAPVSIGVQWTAETSAAERTALERRFALTPTPAPTAGWRPYVLTDYSAANMSALFAEKFVVSVDGIVGSFRLGFAADEPPVPGQSPTVTLAWKADAPAAAVQAVERARGLVNRRIDPANPLPAIATYDLIDVSVPNLTALQQDPLVERVVQGMHFVRVPVVIRLRQPLPEGPPVAVRWHATVTAAQRTVLEQRYSLVHGSADPNDPERMWRRYELADLSEATLAALLAEPAAERVDGVERTDDGHRAREWTPPAGGNVAVIWKTEASEAVIASLERRYRLERDDRQPALMTAYSLADGSPGNIRALLADPHVVETRGIDKTDASLLADSWFAALGRRISALRALPVPQLFHAANAGVWLYYVGYVLPFLVLLVLSVDWLRGRVPTGMPFEARKMFAVGVLMAVANIALLRRLGYFPDHFDASIIMAAWLLGRALRQPWRRIGSAIVMVAAVLVTSVSVIAAGSYVDIWNFAARYKMDGSFQDHVELNREKLNAYLTHPPIENYASAESVGDRAVIRYLAICTRPDDRLWITSDSYAVPYYTQRRVVGHIFWANGFMANPAFERKMIDLVEREQVPLIFGVGGERVFDNFNQYPLVKEYVSKRYTEHHAVLQDNLAGKMLRIAVDSRRTPSGTYAPLGLPCFS